MTHNWLSNIDPNQLTTQNGFLGFDSNRLMTKKKQECWFESAYDSIILLIQWPIFRWISLRMTFFELSTEVSCFGVTFFGMCDFLLGIRSVITTASKCIPENWFESTHDQGGGAGIETGVRVCRSRLFWLELESELESVKFGLPRLRPGVADWHPATEYDFGWTIMRSPENIEKRKGEWQCADKFKVQFSGRIPSKRLSNKIIWS